MKYIQNIPIEGFCLGNENLYSIQQSNVHMKISGKILKKLHVSTQKIPGKYQVISRKVQKKYWKITVKVKGKY